MLRTQGSGGPPQPPRRPQTTPGTPADDARLHRRAARQNLRMDSTLDAHRTKDAIPRPANPLSGGREAPPAGSAQALGLPNRERPVSPPPTPRPGDPPAGRPPSAVLADRYRDHLHSLVDGPQTHQKMNKLLWEHGEPIQRVTAERPPSEVEKAAFKEIAGNIKKDAAHPAKMTQGEFAGTLDVRPGPDGRPQVRTLSHGYFPGGSASFNAPQGSRPPIYYHSHPDNPALDFALGRPSTANTMPSWRDQVSAAEHYSSHGAKNYLITGDQVKVYDGKGGVTELKPSPLEGELPRMRTPLSTTRPEQVPTPNPDTASPVRWNAAEAQGTPASSNSSEGLFQRPIAPPPPARTPASQASSEGLFQKPLRPGEGG